MTTAFMEHRGLGKIVSIPDEVVADIEHLVKYVGVECDAEKYPVTSDTRARLETFIRDIKKKEADDNEMETIIDGLTDVQEDKLKESHMENYHGDKDHWEDSYSSWLEDLTLDELKTILV